MPPNKIPPDPDAPADAPVDPLLIIESDWQLWLMTLFPEVFTRPFADFHVEHWEWVWSIIPGVQPDPRIDIWFRTGGKSVAAELTSVALGARGIRRYGIYLGDTQALADQHVDNIAAWLGRPQMEHMYPLMAEKGVDKFGHQKGWRRNRLHTAAGFVIDALGLDTASRGLRVEEMRPDLLILDDCDDHGDSAEVVARKMDSITRRILPSLTPDAVILGVQNLIHADSIFSQLADGRAPFLQGRVISGPIPAIRDLVIETKLDPAGMPREIITSGVPTWDGYSLDDAQREVSKIGSSAFRIEMQHETPDPTGGIFDHVVFSHVHPLGCECLDTHLHIPDLTKVVCWIDPAITEDGDAQGIQIDGRDAAGTLYRLWSYEHPGSPMIAMREALRQSLHFGAAYIGIEVNQGGKILWRKAMEDAREDLGAAYAHIGFRDATVTVSTGSKIQRASQMLADYERGHIRHMAGTHTVLESALRRFPNKPRDLVDGAWLAWRDLRRLSRPARITSAARSRLDGGPSPSRARLRVVSGP